MKIPTRPMELMLAGWQKTHTGGSKVTFWINDEDLEYFERATVRKGKVAGQRYQAVLVQLTDDDQPDPESVKPVGIVVKNIFGGTISTNGSGGGGGAAGAAGPAGVRPHFPTGLCGLAVKWCDDPHFHSWLETHFPGVWLLKDRPQTEERAAAVIGEVCGIESRKELDTNPDAKALFQNRILVPYARVRKQDGVDE